MKKYTLLSLIFLLLAVITQGQNPADPLLSGLRYRNIGPANQGGRIVDIEARQGDFTKVFAATASGGVWQSDNAGTSWTPIFDDYETASIGDIALDPNNDNIIWVGTGEANNRNSVSWGNGIYKSVDGGKGFKNMGLESTHQIARVLVNPRNSEDVCVCAIGHLWGYTGERGLFQTKNGGNNWNKLDNGLPNDGKTGCTDIVRDSKNPNILYAAFYHRLRQPWHFESGGEQGGIYKSTNNGKSWKRLTTGLPQGPTGRIGLAIYQQNPKILMALVEAAQSEDLNEPGSGVYRSEDGGETWKYVNTYNNRPFYYSQIRINPTDDQKVYVLTTRFMVSTDGGTTFENGSEDQEVHGDFHAMWLDPNYQDRYYLGADKGLSITHDHGKHFTLIDNLPIAQFYRINYDFRTPYYVYGGLQDNGSYATASFSRDARGILSDANWKMHWGDGQNTAINPFDWTDMYSAMENGSFLKYNPQTRAIWSIRPNYLNTINYQDYFAGEPTEMDLANRWNWSAPLIMSPHNPEHIFVASNHLYKSTDQGTSWRVISPDLTTNAPEKTQRDKSGGITPDNTGAERHCSITSVAISPQSESIIWIGTDDGNVQLTTDGGLNWQNLRANVPDVPAGTWVSRIIASKASSDRAYLTFDGHRTDLVEAFIFKTEDRGQTWQRITTGIEGESVRVIVEDHSNANLLFAGTETGVWYTLNEGTSWNRLKLNMPTVSVYDLQIHSRDNDLIVGTHGRSLWILDDISPLQQMSAAVEAKSVHLFKQKPATLWLNISRGGQRGHFWFAGDNPRTINNTTSIPRAGFDNMAAISFYLGATTVDSVDLHITDMSEQHHANIRVKAQEGINRYFWNREFDAVPYTEAEATVVAEALETIMKTNTSNRMRNRYERYQKANTPEKMRRAVESIAGETYLNYIDQRYFIPRADVGTYKVSISTGDASSTSSLRIIADPLEQ